MTDAPTTQNTGVCMATTPEQDAGKLIRRYRTWEKADEVAFMNAMREEPRTAGRRHWTDVRVILFKHKPRSLRQSATSAFMNDVAKKKTA